MTGTDARTLWRSTRGECCFKLLKCLGGASPSPFVEPPPPPPEVPGVPDPSGPLRKARPNWPWPFSLTLTRTKEKRTSSLPSLLLSQISPQAGGPFRLHGEAGPELARGGVRDAGGMLAHCCVLDP